MSGELEKQLAEVVKNTGDAGMKAVDFVMSQAPDVCNQYLLAYRISNSAVVIGCILAIIAVILFVKYVIKNYFQDDDDDKGLVIFIQFVVCSILSVQLIISITNIIYSILTPKLIILQLVVKMAGNDSILP